MAWQINFVKVLKICVQPGKVILNEVLKQLAKRPPSIGGHFAHFGGKIKMDRFQFSEKASRNVQKFYEKGQSLILNVIDIKSL